VDVYVDGVSHKTLEIVSWNLGDLLWGQHDRDLEVVAFDKLSWKLASFVGDDGEVGDIGEVVIRNVARGKLK
jgi:hypothetical protein